MRSLHFFLAIGLWGLLFSGWFNKSQKLKSVLIILGLIVLFSLTFASANLVTRGQAIAFRTVTPFLIVLGLGGVVGLQLISKLYVRNVISVGLLTLLIVCSYLTSEKYGNTYSNAWKTLVSMPDLPQICTQRVPLDEFSNRFQKHNLETFPSIDFVQARNDMGMSSYDFGNAPYVGWVISGACHLLSVPGSPYENSAPGP